LLTVHKAKGLGYPIVVIPEMNSKGSASKDNIRFGRDGTHAEISLSLPDQDKPGLLQKLKEIGDKEEEAEDKRIFYVALTRGIYKVCFLGEGKGKCESNTWWHKYILKPHGLIDADEKALEPGVWPADLINRCGYEDLQISAPAEALETKNWNLTTACGDHGSYRYRTPHDLMGDDRIFHAPESDAGTGMAAGSLYHLCIERGYFDLQAYREDVAQLIDSQFPDADKKELLEKVGDLLHRTRKHDLFRILQDPAIKKYHELSLKGWLKKDGDIIQVNGTLDLLYCEKGSWVVLDFKTDRTKDRLSAYEKQLMSYRWMLKQIYGIEAKTRIFFVALNEIVNIEWNDHYFDHLPVGRGYKPGLPDLPMNAEALLSQIKVGRHLLFCTSSHHEEQICLALMNAGKMRPDITVTTLNKWIASFPVQSTSQDRLRLMIQRTNATLKPGTVDYLAKAFRDHELKKGEIRQEFIPVYEKVKTEPGYLPADGPYRHADVRGVRIGFIDMAPPDTTEKALLARLRLHNEHVDCTLLPETKGKEYDFLDAFSPREEVLAVAKHIRDKAAADDDILITVSSMEKYAPHLKRLFPQMSLQVRFTDMRPLGEYPVTGLIMNVIALSAVYPLNWKDLAAILLHPLTNPGPELLNDDKKRRSKPWEEKPLPQSAQDFIDRYVCKTTDELSLKIGRFIRDYNLERFCEENKLCEKILQIISEVQRDFREICPDSRFSAVYPEIKRRIEKAGLPRKDQPAGIPVLGFLDSLGSVPDKLYVMGMIEGDIPRPENENPCLNRKEKRALELNRHFMDYWKALGERVIFSASRHAEDGTEQNRSAFLQELKLREIREDNDAGRAGLMRYESCLITGGSSNIIHRHNEIVSGSRDRFSGRVNAFTKTFRLPVTAVDTLLACPMRFYYDRVLDLKLTDEEEGKFWSMKRGSVIHKTLEYFMNGGGLFLPQDSGVEKLKEDLYKVLEEEGVDIQDPFQADHFRDYIRDLEPASENNGLIKLLNDLKSRFPEYTRIVSELEFNDFLMRFEDISVYLNGRIDKLMFDDTEKKLIAADYKTGTVNLSCLKKMLLSQLYLYLQKCKADYPEYDIRAAYELIGNADKTKIITFREDKGSFIQERSRSGNAFGIDEFETYLGALFLQIAGGNYYITDRVFRDACSNCPHEGLCRKNTRMRNTV
jgi:RecB family exonuclease